jgi:catechol 2,3-dioxygenase-like lactoylglutathione lyase family enzyme
MTRRSAPWASNRDRGRTLRGAIGGGRGWAVGKPIDGEPACHANGGTIGFHAKTAERVQAFHDAGVAAGGRAIEDPPGERTGPFGPMILAYLRDPSGNKICAMHRKTD